MKRVLTMLFVIIGFSLYAQDNILTADVKVDAGQTVSGGSVNLTFVLHIQEGWHINSAKVPDEYSIPTQIQLEDETSFTLKNISYPKGKITSLSWGGDMSLYEGNISIPAVLDIPKTAEAGKRKITFNISYQACNNVTCMSPESVIKTILLDVAPAPAISNEQIAETNQVQEAAVSSNSNDQPESKLPVAKPETVEMKTEQINDEGPFQNKSMLVILLLVFVMGLALNLTPCVYPLIPITMGYFLAQKESRSPVLLAIMYVLGLAITYSIIGTLAAFGGSMMGSLLANPITLIFFALLMLALSLSMFGLYEFKLPNALTQVGGGSRSGAVGALIMGLTMGIVAAPCVGPFVVSLLGFVAQKGSVVVGFITFFVLALGLGLPYLFLGIFSNKINSLPRSGEWLNGIRIFFGLALIGMSIYFVLPLIPKNIAAILLPAYMIAAAVYYGVIDRSGLSVAWFSRLKVILSMAVLAAGILMIKPGATTMEPIPWDNYSESRLETSIEEKAPVIIDFYADWCNPCKELEHITFSDPEVQALLKDFIRLKVDLTVVNDETNALKEQFDIPGVPTILFYDKTGVERNDLRLNGFEKPKDFIRRLEKVIAE